MDWKDICCPTLMLDEEKCRTNIERMVERAEGAGVRLRPHFKTHQSHIIGRWFREYGVEKAAVSSLQMANYFAEDGWQDITHAFPLNPREIGLVNKLAGNINLHLTMENTRVIEAIGGSLKEEVGIFIKADTGYHRTGLSIDEADQIEEMLMRIDDHPKMKFSGFLAHAGHSYRARGEKDIAKIHRQSLEEAQKFRRRFSEHFPDMIISVGDTPTCSTMESFPGVEEIRPGNFVFYDLSQWQIGSCRPEEIAVAMACPVVAKHP
ncbi:MAG: alanine racemase, partial [Saprospiraceae bacterium]|nr:alanine racemase [Saprospiraceae bacterium]